MGIFKKKENSIDVVAAKPIHMKGKKSADIIKLESKIEEEQVEMNDLYSQIGKLYYELHSNDADDHLLPLCNVVKESQRIIALCEKQILLLQGVKVCHKCGAQLPLDSLFCNKCGSKITDEDASDNEPQNVDNSNNNAASKVLKCRECGSENSDDTIFCTNCGAKIR